MKNGDSPKVKKTNGGAGGRPPIVDPKNEEEVKEFERKIEKYFRDCDKSWRYVGDKDALRKVSSPRPYTMSGLAYALGMDRGTLLRYGKKDQFYSTVKKARDRVHQFQEEKLFYRDSATGAIFALKNNFSDDGWKDKQELEKSGTPDVAVVNIVNYADIKDEDITQ